MLSILIPTYNYYVAPLVQELQKQATVANIVFEIIVIDDASSEKKIVEANNQISTFANCTYNIQQKNLGRTETRQNLALKASFELLLFLDADVRPKHPDFIERFDFKILDWQLQFGGITYKAERPASEEILRWKYGMARESLSIDKRIKDPYQTVNSGAFLIKKELFLKVNSKLKFKKYGLDNLFKQLLQQEDAKIIHIDNPVYHLGLENTTQFIHKSKEAVKTTVELESEGLISHDRRPLQKSYLKLKKLRLLGIFRVLMKSSEKIIEKNLKSDNPSLFLFDLYRLQYYTELKSKKDA